MPSQTPGNGRSCQRYSMPHAHTPRLPRHSPRDCIVLPAATNAQCLLTASESLQVVRELKKTVYTPRMAILVGQAAACMTCIRCSHC